MTEIRGLKHIPATILMLATMSQAGLAQAPKLTDQAIADALEDRYLLDRTLDVNRIDIRVREGIAELQGQVSNLLAKERAGRIAGRVRGVRSVINRIQVVPPEKTTDEHIRREVEQALRTDPAADAEEIAVSVQDNRVTLSGQLESWAELELAVQVAQSVRGVIAVDNALEVIPPRQRQGPQMQAEIERRLDWSVLVDAGRIDVSVEDDVARLSGTVGSLEERRLAASMAHVAGIERVDVSDLQVDWSSDKQALRDTRHLHRTDSQIRQAIQDAAAYDPRLAGFDLQAQVVGSWVTLRGEVGNLEAKRAAVRLARNTTGVRGVNNRLKVRSSEKLSDEAVAAEIERRLVVNPITTGRDIAVEVAQGRAVLSGSVDSYLERGEAERLASKAAGVTDVSNRLVVEYEQAFSEPYYGYDFPTLKQSTERQPAGRSDREIQQAIRQELIWSPYVDADQVEIDVAEGRATLRGTVDSWREYRLAEKNAYDGGARFVTNRLEVE